MKTKSPPKSTTTSLQLWRIACQASVCALVWFKSCLGAAADNSRIADETSTPRPNKGKEREHTPTNNEDEQENNDRNDSGGSRSSEDEDNSEEVETDDNENPDQTRRDTIFHWQIWDELVNHASGGGRFHYGRLWDTMNETAGLLYHSLRSEEGSS